MTTRNRGQERRRTRPTVDSAEHSELELDNYAEREDPAVTSISEGRTRAERRRAERRRNRARQKRIVIDDEEPQTLVVELIGIEYEITVPDVGALFDLADEGALSPKDQLIEWIDEAFNPEDADEVIDRLENGEIKWGRITALIRAVSAATAGNPTG